MEKRIYTLTDINEDLIRCVDRYLKKVMQNVVTIAVETKKKNTGLYSLIWIPSKKSWAMKTTITMRLSVDT